MTTELQSNVLSAGTVKKVMPACLIYAVVQSATFIVDTIVSGHFLGADAIAAVAIGLPVIGLMLAFVAAIMHGGFLKMIGADFYKYDVDTVHSHSIIIQESHI